MRICNIVQSYAGVKDIAERHLASWKKTSDKVIIISPEDSPFVLDGVECLHMGKQGKTGVDSLERAIKVLRYAATLDYDLFVFNEYDSILFKRAKYRDGIQCNVFYDPEAVNRFGVADFFHSPVIFNKARLVEFAEKVEISTHGEWMGDRWLSYQIKRTGIPVFDLQGLNEGFSRNTIDPHDMEALKAAVGRGAYAIHGIKEWYCFHYLSTLEWEDNLVCCYWDNLESMPDGGALMAAWKKSWEDNGWNAVVLTKDDARRHPKFEEIDFHVRTLPTVNPKDYEASCYIRWLAAELSGGRLFVDMDVINHGFKPSDLKQLNQSKVVSLIHNGCPAVIYMPKGYLMSEKLLKYKQSHANWEAGVPHCSDQNMIIWLVENRKEEFEAIDLCSQYGNDGWDQAKLSHYANAAIHAHGQGLSKHEVIEKILAG